jgi:spermidine/putrescine transport system permease protein
MSATGTTHRAKARFWHAALWAYVIIFFIFLYGPLLVITLLSFNDSEIVALPFRGLTLKWYAQVFADEKFRQAFLNSVLVGLLTGVISTALALTAALGFRRPSFLSALLLPIILIPIVVPGLIGGVVLLLVFGFFGMPFGVYNSVLAAHINWALPFAFLTLYPRLHSFDRSVEEAAMDLGARPLMVFTRVILPMIRPALVATFLFSFTLSFDEFVRTLFVIGPDRTLPVQIWILVVDRMAPFLPAASVVVMGVTVLVSLFAFFVSATGSRSNA